MVTEPNVDQIREAVRRRYAAEAKRVTGSERASCCSGSSCCDTSSRLYARDELQGVPREAALASLGCGNPTLVAELKPGEVVLDLGSGGGIDVLLSARRVGPSGKAYGLDMTDEMLELARANAAEAGLTNVEFLKGNIEAIPLPDASVDVIISNCVINLSADKDAVLAEAYRVLKPGGRFAVADIVIQGEPLPAEMRQSLALWSSCVSGALSDDEYRQKLAAAGFTDIDIRVLESKGAEDLNAGGCCSSGVTIGQGTRIASALIGAWKPE